jgi:hypothetical protein
MSPDEEEEEEEEDDDDDDEKEEEDMEMEEEEEEEEPAILAGQYIHSSASPSQVSTQNEHSLTTDTALPESDTSLDELQRDYYPPAKRSSKPRHSQHRKRRTGRRSTQDEESE